MSKDSNTTEKTYEDYRKEFIDLLKEGPDYKKSGTEGNISYDIAIKEFNKKKQQLLKNMGLLKGKVDGVYGLQSRTAENKVLPYSSTERKSMYEEVLRNGEEAGHSPAKGYSDTEDNVSLSIRLQSILGAKPDGQFGDASKQAVDDMYDSADVADFTYENEDINKELNKLQDDFLDKGEVDIEAILKAAAKTGADIDYKFLEALVQQESKGITYAKPETSDAVGIAQFVAGTWDGVKGELKKRYGIENPSRLNPVHSALGLVVLTEKNIASYRSVVNDKKAKPSEGDLNDKKAKPSEGDLYALHFLGAGGFEKLYNAKDTDDIPTLLPAAAKANKNIFYNGDVARSKSEVFSELSNKMTKAHSSVAKKKAALPPKAPDGGFVVKVNSGGKVGSPATIKHWLRRDMALREALGIKLEDVATQEAADKFNARFSFLQGKKDEEIPFGSTLSKGLYRLAPKEDELSGINSLIDEITALPASTDDATKEFDSASDVAIEGADPLYDDIMAEIDSLPAAEQSSTPMIFKPAEQESEEDARIRELF